MYKHIMLLGLLLHKPMYGQQIREVIENHHELFANHIKKPTIYYQLERLAADGYLEIRREAVEAPGPGAAHDDVSLRERDVYYLTPAGRAYFAQLLRTMLGSYTPGLDEVETCLFFLHHLSPDEARSLLGERLQQTEKSRDEILQKVYASQDPAHRLVYEHKQMLLDAEILWLRQTIGRLAD